MSNPRPTPQCPLPGRSLSAAPAAVNRSYGERVDATVEAAARSGDHRKRGPRTAHDPRPCTNSYPVGVGNQRKAERRRAGGHGREPKATSGSGLAARPSATWPQAATQASRASLPAGMSPSGLPVGLNLEGQPPPSDREFGPFAFRARPESQVGDGRTGPPARWGVLAASGTG